LAGQAWIYARERDDDNALAVLNKLSQLAGGRDLPSLSQALVYAQLGDLDMAFKLLDEGISKRDSNLVYLLCEPGFKPLRSDHRFDEVLRRMNLYVYR